MPSCKLNTISGIITEESRAMIKPYILSSGMTAVRHKNVYALFRIVFAVPNVFLCLVML